MSACPRRGAYLPLGVAMALLVLAADQASKWWVLHGIDLPEKHSIALLPVLNLTMVWNRGVTFGLLDGLGGAGRFLLAGVAVAVVAALLVWLRRAERAWVAGAIGAIAGGAVGNVIDRLRFGAVVDFIHAHAYGWSWYVFNVADAAIVCGVGVLLLDGLRPRRPAGPPESCHPEPCNPESRNPGSREREQCLADTGKGS